MWGHSSQIVIVYDGNTHTVFPPEMADDIRKRKFRIVHGGWSNTESTAIHELLHSLIWWQEIDVGDLDQQHELVGEMDFLIEVILKFKKRPDAWVTGLRTANG